MVFSLYSQEVGSEATPMTLIVSINPENVEPQAQPPVVNSLLYKCLKCKETFDKISLYKRHMLHFHKHVKKYKCETCSASYNIEQNHKIHMAIHAEGRPTCPICHVSFQRSASLKSHLMVHQLEELYNCDQCSAEFDKEEDLNKHLQHAHISMASTSENGCLVCPYCKWQFDDQKQYKTHLSKHNKVKKMVLGGKRTRRTYPQKEFAHICSICLKSFPKLSLLDRHLRVHTGERPYVCEVCKRGFSQKGTLEIHSRKHKDIKPYHCTLCPARFSQKGNLRVHVEKTHVAPDSTAPLYKCTQCACIFRKLASLNVHVTRTHATKHNEEIGELIKQIKELNEENRPMEGEPAEETCYVKLAESYTDGSIRRYLVKQRKKGDSRVYLCNLCSWEFKKPSDLIRHIRTHTKEKPFACKFCTAQFAVKSTLNSHMKTHEKVQIHACSICDKKFTVARLLNLHLKKHEKSASSDEADNILEPNPADVLLFECPTCGANFALFSELNTHLEEHANNQNYPCKLCNKQFASNALLKRHFKKHVANSERDKLYFCASCDYKVFKSASLYKKHLEAHRIFDEEKEAQENEPLIGGEVKSIADNVVISEENQQQMYQIDGNPIQIVTNSGKEDGAVQTIFINCQDLQITPVQNADTMLFNTITNAQEPNVFGITADFTQTAPEMNQILNITEPEIIEQANSTIITKQKGEQLPEILPANAAPYDLNLFFNLEGDFGANQCDIPNYNLNMASLNDVSMQAPNETENEKEEKSKNSEKDAFECVECSKMFVSKLDYEKHEQSEHGMKKPRRSHNCTMCYKTFKKQSDLIRHTRTHTGEKPYACNLCDKKFSLKSTLASHKNTHDPVGHKKHNCVVCNSSFTTKSTLKTHMNIHTGEKPYKCVFCQQKFRTWATRRTHEKMDHINPGKRKSQSQKDKVTNLLASVVLDDLNQQQEEEVALDSNVQLLSSDLLENVLLLQDQDQLQLLADQSTSLPDGIQLEPMLLQSNFLLQDQQSFIQLNNGIFINIKGSDLVANEPETEASSERVRNLECDVCHKMYASKDVLRKHKKIHGVNRKFPCLKCDRGFDFKEELQRHSKIHSGGMPFKCMHCNNRFVKEQGLFTHLKRIHGLSRENKAMSSAVK